MDKKTIVLVVGTRPEAIKMAPVALELKKIPHVRCIIVKTGQHGLLVDQPLNFFGVKVDYDLHCMKPNQTISHLTSQIISRLSDLIYQIGHVDYLLAQGDTVSVLASALVSCFHKIPFGHIEAGLRTFCRDDPHPEEAIRVCVSDIANVHFAPTVRAEKNLINEGIDPRNILVTGNTSVDAIRIFTEQAIGGSNPFSVGKRGVLVTMHRRENIGSPIRNMISAIENLGRSQTDIEFVWPMHPNSNLKSLIDTVVIPRQLIIVPPMDYCSFVNAMQSSYIIMTDSGGVQEEASALNIPILVIRGATERQEAVEVGAAKLVGTECLSIQTAVENLLDNTESYEIMKAVPCPFGDGDAAKRIVRRVIQEA